MDNKSIRNEIFHYQEQMKLKSQESESTIDESREIAIKTIKLINAWQPEINSQTFNDLLNMCISDLKKGIENAKNYYSITDETKKSTFFREVTRPIEDALELFIHNTE